MRRYLFLLVVTIFLSGCNSSYFEYPLVFPDKDMELDLRLAGHWELVPAASGMDRTDYAFIQFLWDGNFEGWYAVNTFEMLDDSRNSGNLIAFAQEINGVGYLNYVDLTDLIGREIETDEEDGEDEMKFEYHIQKYELTGANELRFYQVDDDLIKDAIRKGLLSGHIFKEGHYHVTARSEELLEFVRNNDIFDYSEVRVYRYRDIGIPIP